MGSFGAIFGEVLLCNRSLGVIQDRDERLNGPKGP